MLGLILGAFVETTSAATFEEVRTFPSYHAYQKSLKIPFVEKQQDRLAFFNGNGRLLKTIDLKDSQGYERNLFSANDRIVIIKSTHGYEWANSSIEFFTNSGNKAAEITATSESFAIAPGGKSVVMAQRGSAQYSNNGPFTIYGPSGKKLAEHEIQGIPMSIQYTFSDDGELGVILFKGQRRPQAKSTMLVFSDSGEQVARFESADWSPLSQDIVPSGRLSVAPLTRIDSKNRVLVIGGQDFHSLEWGFLGVDFQGSQLWRRMRPTGMESCPSTLILRPASAAIILTYFCSNIIILNEIDVLTGKDRSTREIPTPDGKVISASFSNSPNEERLLINLLKMTPSGKTKIALLLNSQFHQEWLDASFPDGAGEARFDKAGMVILDREKVIRTGRFKY